MACRVRTLVDIVAAYLARKFGTHGMVDARWKTLPPPLKEKIFMCLNEHGKLTRALLFLFWEFLEEFEEFSITQFSPWLFDADINKLCKRLKFSTNLRTLRLAKCVMLSRPSIVSESLQQLYISGARQSHSVNKLKQKVPSSLFNPDIYCPNLMHVTLHNIHPGTLNKLLAKLAKSSPNLESIDLSRCQYKVPYALSFPSLVTLNLSETQTEDMTLSKIAANCPNLKSLDIHQCSQLRHPNIFQLSHLVTLDFADTQMVSDSLWVQKLQQLNASLLPTANEAEIVL